jgi:anaphase-promoting complex subunit 7
VREAVTALDLDVTIMPSPRGSRYRLDVEALGGKSQFPFLVDGSKSMYESDAIIAYLTASYGPPDLPPRAVSEVLGGPIGLASGLVASALRGFRGGALSRQSLPALKAAYQPLELYSYENNQFCRPVRELLCELALPYRLKSTGKGSPRRTTFAKVRGDGTTACPFLVDPNTGVRLGESSEILDYLTKTYSIAQDPSAALRTIKAELLELAEASSGGVKEENNERIAELIVLLENLNTSPTPVFDAKLNGVWELVWTTEKEVLFAKSKGLFLDGPCVGVTQTIDLDGGRLENRIYFEGGGALSVSSTLTPDADGKGFQFSFDACSLKWRQGPGVPLPPVGKGAAKVTFLDNDIRVQRDSRGDTLVCIRREVLMK